MAQANPALEQHTTSNPQTQTQGMLSISLETLLYLGILILAASLRLFALGNMPLNDDSAREALSVLRRVDVSVVDSSTVLYPLNSLGGFFNGLAMLALGDGDAIPRLPTAIVGVLLALSPWLFRKYLPARLLLFLSLGLTLSPVAIAASRTMGHATWSLLFLLMGLRLTLHFAETRHKESAIAATVCLMAATLMTSPAGFLAILGVFWGLILAVSRQKSLKQPVAEILDNWPFVQGIGMGILVAAAISTGFFMFPDGLTSMGYLLETFFSGLVTRPENTPFAFGLLVSLRYDLIFVIFALAGTWSILRGERDDNSESDALPGLRFFEHVMAGWFLWSVFSLVFYQGTTADMALLITLPAVGITAAMVMQMIKNPSRGYWLVPGYVVPIHALLVAVMLTNLGMNLQRMGIDWYNEAKVIRYAKVFSLENDANGRSDSHIGSLTVDGDSSMVVKLPIIGHKMTDESDDPVPFVVSRTVTFQVELLDKVEGVNPVFVIRDPQGNPVYGPVAIEDGITGSLTGELEGEYRLDVLKGEQSAPLEHPVQFIINVYPEDLTNKSGLKEISSGAFWLRFPELTSALLITTRTTEQFLSRVLTLMLMLLIPMTFFLVGAIYGSRAAWRGLGLGMLMYMGIFGIGIGWRATAETGDDIRELWTVQSAPQDYRTIESVLNEMSRRDNGTVDLIAVTVQGKDDGTLAWALRHFPHVRFVDSLDAQVHTPIVIAPDMQPPPTLGADYVGQQLILDYHWQTDYLNWTDSLSWLFNTRRTRFEPEASQVYRLWVTKDVYDVKQIPQ